MNAPSHTTVGLPAISPPILRVQHGTHHDPFEVLGVHAQPDGSTLIRAFLPAAEAVEVAAGPMLRVTGTDCFERLLPAGSEVEAGAPLLVIEAMKMEHTIVAPAAGRVAEVLYRVGDPVAEGAELIRFAVVGPT